MKEFLEKIEDIAFAIAEGSRENMVNKIMEYAGDEYESVSSVINLAKETDEQIKFHLYSIIKYYANQILEL